MTEESKSSKFLGRLKEATSTVASKAKEGVEELQTKHELSQAYGDLGRKAADLVEAGTISNGELTPLVDKIRELKAQLEAAPATDEPAAPADEPAPPAES